MEKLLADLEKLELTSWADDFKKLVGTCDHHAKKGHGLGGKLSQLLEQLPIIQPDSVDLKSDSIRIGSPHQLNDEQRQAIKSTLMDMYPWRKGPFNLFGIDIDTEWNSALKWNRIVPHISPLKNRKVLDIGSSSGYYLFKMAAEEASMVLGVEPFISYYYQYLALQRYLHIPQAYTLPTRLENLPPLHGYFDSVFCMGILYHRRSPLDFLKQMATLLRPNGELIMETLTIPGTEEISLTPRERYAKMHNVFFLPTVNCLILWLERCGFTNVTFVSTHATTTEEQHPTQWIRSESLDCFLDPTDSSKTIEGYPAPERTILIAQKKK